jgi:hypothetical protein
LALGPDGRIWHIDAAPRGEQHFVCPACQLRLTAYKGARNAHHFHHDPGVACAYGLETLLHLWAKQYLPSAGRIRVPELIVHAKQRMQIVQQSTDLEYDDVRLENRLGSIVPDIVVRTAIGDLVVEIAVTHRADQDKREKLKALGLGTIEIYLPPDDVSLSPEGVTQLTLFDAPREWLFHSGYDAAVRALEQRRADERQRWLEAKKREREPSVLRMKARLEELRQRLPATVQSQANAVQREEHLEAMALTRFGRDSDWTIEPHPLLDGHTPRALARTSTTGLARALDALNGYKRQ